MPKYKVIYTARNPRKEFNGGTIIVEAESPIEVPDALVDAVTAKHPTITSLNFKGCREVVYIGS